MNYRYKRPCFVCGTKNLNVSYHKFPADNQIKTKWLRFCRYFLPYLREDDSTKNLVLCSDHFKEEDFITSRRKNKKFLCKRAIPTVYEMQIVEIEPPSAYEFAEVIRENPSIEYSNSEYPATEFANTLDLQISDDVDNLEYIKIEPATDEELEIPGIKPGDNTDIQRQQNSPSSSKKLDVKRSRKRMHYMGDFTLGDMSSPEKARKYFTVSKETLHKNAQTIRSLHQRTRRLVRKVKNLREITSMLMMKDCVSEEDRNEIFNFIVESKIPI